VIVNATGAWGDLTLGELRIPAPRLLGGTKGSHFITYQPALKAALGDAGVYAEADDGRLVFVLPFGAAVLVGTTDERFDESPERAVATDHEIDYLVGMVNELFPQIGLSRADVTLTYSGVRPLPYSAGGPEGAISRDHSIAVQQADGLPVLTLVGGKLTTSRALGEQVTDDILQRLRMTRTAMTVGRFLPGGRALPPDAGALDPFGKDVPLGLDAIQVQVLTQLCGNRFAEILERHPPTEEDRKRGNRLTDTLLPRSFVRWVIDHEWVARIEDLVERRLMLLYEKNLSMRTLEDLADLLIEAGKLRAADRNSALVTARQRLQTVYGRTLTE
jgi:glycerol-3-phosphate dehydrogenase